MQAYIESVAVTTSGVDNWAEAKAIFTGKQLYKREDVERFKPTLLPPNERRRATSLVRLAFKACESATAYDWCDRSQLASVFASSGGDYKIIDQICRSLCTHEKMVSPTQFHNSVHNSAAGYWCIATQSVKPSESISAYDYSFCMGLIESFTQILSTSGSLLFVVYDDVPPEPLVNKRKIEDPFACAFVLSPVCTEYSIGSIEIAIDTDENVSVTQCSNSDLEKIRNGNPAARTLPLLETIAKQESKSIILENLSGYLAIKYTAL